MRPIHHLEPSRADTDMSHFVYTGIAVIFWAAVIFGLVMLLNRYARRSDVSRNIGHDPLDTIKLRYAKGEISRDEFNQLKKDLA